MKTLRRRLTLHSLEARDVPASGDLDVKFADEGILSESYDEGGSFADAATASIVLANGKTVVAVQVEQASGFRGYLSKFNKDGSADTTFGDQGTALVTANVAITALASQGSKLVFGGTFDDGSGNLNFFVGRVLKTGEYDETFDDNGQVLVPVDLVNGGDDRLEALVVKGNKVVAVGTSDGTDGDSDFSVVQLDKTGQLDPKFGQLVDTNNPRGPRTGKVSLGGTMEFPAELSGAVAAFQGSKLVVAGTIGADGVNSFDSSFLVIRFTPKGDLDFKFNDGVAFADPDLGGTNDDVVTGIAIQGSKIVVVGDSATGDKPSVSIARFDNSGQLDLKFSEDGLASIVEGESARVAVKGSGIYVACNDLLTDTQDLYVTKLNKNGEIDGKFGGKNPSFGGSYDTTESLTGLHVVGGRVTLVGTIEFDGADTDLGIVRYIA